MIDMATQTFDTYRAVKDLQQAGFDEAQAEAVVNTLGNVIDRDVVKPPDLKDFATKSDVGQIRTEMKELELRVTIRLTGVVLATGGLVIAVLKIFP